MDSIRSRRRASVMSARAAAVGEPERERVGAEQHRERQRDRTELVDRDVGDGGLDALGKDDPDPIPAPYAEPGERVGEAIAEPFQIREGEGLLDALRVLDVDGSAIADVRVPIADVDADVVALRNVPPEACPNLVEREGRLFDEPHVLSASPHPSSEPKPGPKSRR